MKKILLLSIVAIIATVSCNKENNPVASGKTTTFVGIADNGTKTTIGTVTSTSASVLWKGAESISIVGSQNYKFDGAASEEGQSSLAFSYVGDDYNETDVVAAYPYNADVTWNSETKTVSGLKLVESNAAVAGSFAPNAAVSVAVPGEDNTLNFKNLHALIKLTIGDANVSKVCIYTADGTPISGTFSVSYDGVNPVVAAGTSSYSEITGTITKGETYYIPVLPVNIAAGQFVLEYTIHGDKLTKKKSEAFNIERNKVYDMGEISLIDEWFPTDEGKVTIYTYASSFAANRLYYWGDGITAPTWPGIESSGTVTVDQKTYYKYQIEKTTISGTFNFLFNANGGKQTVDINDMAVKDLYVYKAWDTTDRSDGKYNAFEFCAK